MVGNAPKPARFEETQRLGQNRLVRTIMVIEPVFLGLVFLVLGLSVAGGAWIALVAGWLVCAVVVPLVVSRVRMTTLVTGDELLVRLSIARYRLALREVETAEPVRYDPISEVGGWGVKLTRKFGRVYNVFGDRGVAIVAGKKRVMIGTQRPDELAEAILEGAIETSPSRE